VTGSNILGAITHQAVLPVITRAQAVLSITEVLALEGAGQGSHSMVMPILCHVHHNLEEFHHRVFLAAFLGFIACCISESCF